MKIGYQTYTPEQTEEIKRVKEIVENLQKEIDIRYSNLRKYLNEKSDDFLFDYVFNDFQIEKDE